MPEGTFSPINPRGTPRVDGRAKVTGGARYPSDMPVVNPAWAFLVTSAVSRGRIARMDLSGAQAVPGVFDIMTHENTAGQVADAGFFGGGGYSGTTIRPLESADVRHDGEIVAVVLADSYETAREAGHRVRVEYEAEEPSSTFGSPGVTEKAATLAAALPWLEKYHQKVVSAVTGNAVVAVTSTTCVRVAPSSS